MLKVITCDNEQEWNHIINNFDEYDTYYTIEYVKPFAMYEGADPLLLYYRGKSMELCYIIEKEDIAKFLPFNKVLSENTYYDATTPYGYGGPLVKKFNKEDFLQFVSELKIWAKKNNIVTQFFRFHPLLDNFKYLEDVADILTFKQTIFMDLENEEVIYKNMTDKCRNMVKKAIKNNLVVEIDNSKNSILKFKELYKNTMIRNNASEYYFFNDSFFDALFIHLGTECNIFVVKSNGTIISSAVIFEKNNFLHYHLSAADRDYMNLGGNNLLLYEVAKYGCKKGYKKFHLGGGTGSEDALFSFKKSFNKNGLVDFYIGRIIFDKEKYNELMNIRKNLDNNFDLKTSRLIGYRA